MPMISPFIQAAERGWLPDGLLRIGMRRLLRQRLQDLAKGESTAATSLVTRFAADMRGREMVEAAESANSQHYEVPASFFQRVLGSRLKYSCGYWQDGITELDQSEDAMLGLTCQRAEIEDGMAVLDLGCGWGSLSLWIAQHYPDCRVVAVSNSHSQRSYIEQRREDLGLQNLRTITRNVADLDFEPQFDRVVSVEMFEHIRNYEQLLRRIAAWLRSDGKLFVHIFCHRSVPYRFEVNGPSDWMTRHFFAGGIMPSADLLAEFESDLVAEQQWRVSGLHYSRTCEAWLRKLDQQRDEVLAILERDGDSTPAQRQLQRWRMFFMACSELFAYDGGAEWFVLHALLVPSQLPRVPSRENVGQVEH